MLKKDLPSLIMHHNITISVKTFWQKHLNGLTLFIVILKHFGLTVWDLMMKVKIIEVMFILFQAIVNICGHYFTGI